MSPALWSLVLFARLDAVAILDNALRRSLVERVRDRPGLNLREAAHALGVHPTTARHHARMLERAGRLVVVEEGRARLLFLPGGPRRSAPAPRALRALEAIREGAASPAALARVLDVPRGTAGSLLASLERMGLVAREEGAWRLTPRAREHLPPPDACA